MKLILQEILKIFINFFYFSNFKKIPTQKINQMNIQKELNKQPCFKISNKLHLLII